MSKEIYYKLTDELGREPTEEEVADRMADMIDYSHERGLEEKFEKPAERTKKPK